MITIYWFSFKLNCFSPGHREISSFLGKWMSTWLFDDDADDAGDDDDDDDDYYCGAGMFNQVGLL